MHLSREAPDDRANARSDLSDHSGGHAVPAAVEPARAVAPRSRRGAAIQHAVLSAFIPGAAQVAQGRWLAGMAQFGVVFAYLVGILAAGPTQAIWLAIFWNAYSALEAYWYEKD